MHTAQAGGTISTLKIRPCHCRSQNSSQFRPYKAMKKSLLLILVLFSQSGLAELYKCSTATGTTYQGKPCAASQTQKIIPPPAPTPASKSTLTPTSILASPAAAPTYNSLAIERDAHGKIKRSEKAKNDFKSANPCPATGKRAGSCPGYVIDHINALACGGADSPENMQWQTVTEGKEKDGWERDGCKMPTKQPSYQQDLPPAEESPPQTVYTGKYGGRYVLSKGGKKHYLPRK